MILWFYSGIYLFFMEVLTEKIYLAFITIFFSVFSILVFYSTAKLLEMAGNQSVPYLFKNKKDNQISLKFAESVYFGALSFGMGIFWLGIFKIAFPIVILSLSVIVLVLNFVLNWKTLIKNRCKFFKNNIFGFAGILIAFFIGFCFSFRPILNFDGLWYHIPISKYFLQTGQIAYAGEHLRYSVHPYLNFFLNMLPLSLPFETIVNGMIINILTFVFVLIGVSSLFKYLKGEFNLSPIIQLFGPSLLIFTAVGAIWLGSGYNDVYTIGITSLVLANLLEIWNTKSFSKIQFGKLVLLSIMLFLFKIFFGLFSILLFVYSVILYISINHKAFSSPKFNLKKLKQFIFPIIKIATFLCILFVLPWFARSFYYTGRIMDPIGAPFLAADVYNFAGSGNAKNHFGKFITDRFYSHILSVLFTAYTPLFGIGIFSVFNRDLKKKTGELWSLGFLGFWGVYFASIVTEWRYFLPAATILICLGILVIDNLFKKNRFFTGILLAISVFACIPFIYVQNHFGKSEWDSKLYLNKTVTIYNLAKTHIYGNSLNYFSDKNTVKPDGLKKDEPVLIGGIHNLAYIENPIIDPRLDIYDFKKIANLADLKNYLNNRKCRYLLLKNAPLEIYISEIVKLKWDKNEFEKVFEKTEFDANQNATWYKINY